jgi:hypothetical protein
MDSCGWTSKVLATSLMERPSRTSESTINNLFHLRRDHLPAIQYQAARIQALQMWAEVTGVAALA